MTQFPNKIFRWNNGSYTMVCLVIYNDGKAGMVGMSQDLIPHGCMKKMVQLGISGEF
ncbi:hypothetical protein [Nitrosomonas sp.]|uniref:hypothetical protein n=1 Tax=Nitrosomonas sp. TaxID=42353 RepID=UPI00263510B5|nr:hypothetical protein [Nitrosomonas sp.]